MEEEKLYQQRLVEEQQRMFQQQQLEFQRHFEEQHRKERLRQQKQAKQQQATNINTEVKDQVSVLNDKTPHISLQQQLDYARNGHAVLPSFIPHEMKYFTFNQKKSDDQ